MSVRCRLGLLKISVMLMVAMGTTAAPRVARSVDSARFKTSLGPTPYLTVDGTQTLGAREVAVSLRGTYEKRPLIFQSDGARTADLVSNRASAELAAAYGLLAWLDVGVAMPYLFAQSGVLADGDSSPPSSAMGDPRVALKVRLLDKATTGFGAAWVVSASGPLGDPSAFVGESGMTGTSQIALELPLGWRFDFALNGGFRAREPSKLEQLRVDEELVGGAAISGRLTPSWAIVAESNVSTPAARPFQLEDETPADANLGMRFRLWRGLELVVGAGAGIRPGYGSPQWRAFVGIDAAPRRHDFDGDGVTDGLDRCVALAGSEPERGCPRIALLDPAARIEPPDAVARSVPADRDGDAIPDHSDRCPALAEDADGFLDADGCPDFDNDLDLVPDAQDGAPLQPEDWDAFEDSDGVPDVTSDGPPSHARVVCDPSAGPCDQATAPSSPQGESDERRSTPLLLGDTIHPGYPVIFERARPELTTEAQGALNGLASYLLGRPELRRVEVGVHVDAMGSRAWKRRLSQRRAQSVTAALIARGVAEARLLARGYGPSVPVATNTTKAGRARNRRVELRVLEQDAVNTTKAARLEARGKEHR